jgi:radical SAM protein with 4Fe4S-binding SPASM domain
LCEKYEDGVLLHNCITGCTVFLSRIESEFLNTMPTGYLEEITPLIERYFLVPVDYDEKATVDTLRKMMCRLFTPKGINGYTIMTTTNCNARCFYCYQANYRHINMTKETAEHLVKYMVEHKGTDALRLQWFGGEPLVGIARIDQISEELQNLNIEFTSSMISNGYLFTEEIVRRAKESWKLKNIQITLDGTEEIYNRTKAYVTEDGNPYKRVLRNISLLLEQGIHVGVRLNLDQHNGEDLHKLIGEIDRLIPDKKNLNVYAHVVYENEGYAPIARNEVDNEDLYRRQFDLNKAIFEAGLCSRYYSSLPSLKYRSCMADNPRSVIVYPDGSLYNCEHTAEGDSFGHIDSDDRDESVLARFMVPSDLEICPDCPLYPSCLILKECEGLKSRNAITCKYEINMKSWAMKHHYQDHLSSKVSDKTGEDSMAGQEELIGC